jgi:hypothetical protein
MFFRVTKKNILLLFLFISINSFGQNDLNLSDELFPLTSENILKLSNYYIWESSVVKDGDEKFYMFYNR